MNTSKKINEPLIKELRSSFEHTSSGSTFEKSMVMSHSSTPKLRPKKKFKKDIVDKSNGKMEELGGYFDIE